jgi:hypothetical protein
MEKSTLAITADEREALMLLLREEIDDTVSNRKATLLTNLLCKLTDQTPPGNDVDMANEGSLISFKLISEAARDWAKEHLPDDAPRMGSTVFVEPRYASDILNGMESDGLTIGR